MIHTVKGFGVVNNAELDVFMELSLFVNDPTDVGNLISGSSAFTKSSLNIFNLSLNLAIRSSWSEPKSAPGLVFADCIELLHLWLQRI